MRNANEPAAPIENTSDFHPGLTKHELFCLHLGVDETGDPELDDVIRKGERKRLSGVALQGLLASGDGGVSLRTHAMVAVSAADCLQEELEKSS